MRLADVIRQLGEKVHPNVGHTSCVNVSLRRLPFTLPNLNNNDRGVAPWSHCSSGFGILSALKMLKTFKFITRREERKAESLALSNDFLIRWGCTSTREQVRPVGSHWFRFGSGWVPVVLRDCAEAQTLFQHRFKCEGTCAGPKLKPNHESKLKKTGATIVPSLNQL